MHAECAAAAVPAAAAAERAAAALPPAPVRRAPWLRTRRLQLRELDLGDALLLLQLDRCERVHRLLLDDHAHDLKQACALVLWLQQLYREHPGLGIWHARLHEGPFVGTFSLMPVADGDTLEIGVRLLPQWWGRGLPVEIGRALCAHAFDTLGRDRVLGVFDPGNRGAELALRRLGFAVDGEDRRYGRSARRYMLAREIWQSGPGRSYAAAAATTSGG